MPITKIYKCCICHKQLEEIPIRLVKQKFDNTYKSYGRYKNIVNYDFCSDCYKKFNMWICTHIKEG